MAWEPENDEQSAFVRRMMDQSVSKFVRKLGFEDADDLREAIGKPSTRRESTDPASIRAQVMKELAEERAKEDEARKSASKAKDDEKARDAARQEELDHINARNEAKIELLAAGIKRADLNKALRLYEVELESLTDDAAREALTPEAFVGSIGQYAPHLFEDGRAPAVGQLKVSTTAGSMPQPVKPGTAPVVKDYSNATPEETRQAVQDILAGK